jgi:hypothetical protein
MTSMAQLSDKEIEQRIDDLAKTMRQRGLAFSDTQARERARGIVMQEVRMQGDFDKIKDDPALNPQQRKSHFSDEEMKNAGGMLTGNELPKDVPLSELLKGRPREQKK